MKLFDSSQMRAADAAAAAAGVSGVRLMEAAGAAVAGRLLEKYPATDIVLVLCGKGNNGGDGYVAARLLAARGVSVEVCELGALPSTADAAQARAALVDAGVTPVPLASASLGRRLAEVATRSAVVVDALLGCGLDRPLAGMLAEVVALVNAAAVPVVAVDVPTGVSADSPLLPGPHVMADVTVQLAGAKLASAFYPARAAYARGPAPDVAAGVADIGIPPEILDALSSVTLLTDALCALWMPAPSPAAHKYSAGTVTVVGGSSSYAGAAELACRGAWRGGAGLVTLVSDHRHPAAWPETVYRPLSVPEKRAWPPPGLSPRAAAACVVGPGLAEEAASLLAAVVAWTEGPVIVDAGALAPDALWPALSGYRSSRPDPRTRPAGESTPIPFVMTPHAGEAARLLATTSQAVEADPLAAAQRLSSHTGAVVILKGPATVIASPDGATAVSTRGHPGMASGGTGDVLAGLVGALCSTAAATTTTRRQAGRARDDVTDEHPRPRILFELACVAVYAHGVAGERAAATHGQSLIASDLVDELSGVLAGLAHHGRAAGQASGGC